MAKVCIPGAAELLGLAVHEGDVFPEIMVRLAVSSRIRGSGPSVDRARKLQTISTAVVGKVILTRQSWGVERWLQRSELATRKKVLGFSAMWDEASQRLRALIERIPGEACSALNSPSLVTKSQKVIEVMVTLWNIYQARLGETCGGANIEWQPFICKPMFLASTGHEFILAGLFDVLPLNLPDSVAARDWCSNAEAVVVCLCFDSASSNFSAYRYLLKLVASLPNQVS